VGGWVGGWVGAKECAWSDGQIDPCVEQRTIVMRSTYGLNQSKKEDNGEKLTRLLCL